MIKTPRLSCKYMGYCSWELLNSLWPSDAIWRHRSGSTLAQVMACCLTAPSHYLNQYWLKTSVWPCGIQLRMIFTRTAQDIYPWYQFENYWFKTSTTSFRDQWISDRKTKRCAGRFLILINTTCKNLIMCKPTLRIYCIDSLKFDWHRIYHVGFTHIPSLGSVIYNGDCPFNVVLRLLVKN